uniref:Disease resistance protein RGA3 n=1 Tax=Populus alba TaxID=43335 RepID=A0A4U5Q3J8_POPAL|nr:hypothetical protein D5086_0000140340 [Populus alba]
MAEGVLFNIAVEIIKTLGSLTAQEVALWWGIKDQLRKLNDTVTRIKAVIQDAEEQAQKQNHQIEDWLMKLREAVYDAEDLLDDFSTQVLRKQLMPGKRVSREVRLFFSRSNQFVYGLRMGHRVEALRERLDGIEIDSKKFNFDVRGEERASLTTVREQTTSSEPEITVGRESVKEAVKSFLMKSNYEHNVSVLSVVGMGGLGKTTLAQHVFNDEQVKAHFGVRLWVSVSGGLDVRKIIKGALEGLSVDESWELFRRKAFPQGQESGHVDEKIRKEIVERCCGVPLVLKAIARLMSLKDRAQWLPFIQQELPNRSIKVERGGKQISNNMTRHVSFDMVLDLAQQMRIPLPFAKCLRTLMLQIGKWDKGTWVSICRDFRRLRVLVSSHLGMKEVSPLIKKLKHLKYLDLSNNNMEALPNSITNLVNLQVLKLNGCSKLKELPRSIDKLINLRHLDVGCSLDHDLCDNLDLKSEMIGGLDELSMLNELRGRLEIRVMRSTCISEFEGAKLKDKQYLQSLTVGLGPELDSDSDMQSLQPNSSLQELRVKVYGGMRFPSWVSNLSNLVSIGLEYCVRIKHIPPLDGIPSLEKLSVWRLDDLEYIDSEGVGGKGASTFFPSLKRLDIIFCPRLKGWRNRWSRDEMNDDSDESIIE